MEVPLTLLLRTPPSPPPSSSVPSGTIPRISTPRLAPTHVTATPPFNGDRPEPGIRQLIDQRPPFIDRLPEISGLIRFDLGRAMTPRKSACSAEVLAASAMRRARAARLLLSRTSKPFLVTVGRGEVEGRRPRVHRVGLNLGNDKWKKYARYADLTRLRGAEHRARSHLKEK
jgi:hypothetical protein